MQKGPRVVLTLLLLLMLPGSLYAFWPVYWEFDGQKNLLGPLISYQGSDTETHFAVRPLLASYDAPRKFSFLWPLGKSTEEESYLLPFYRRTKSPGSSDVSLFPFFYGTTGERSYWGVFPFYGKLYGRFSRDEIGFLFWPGYGYSIADGATRRDELWPLFSFYSGTQQGFKLGPLYGRRQWGTDRRSSFVLWPFFIRDEKSLGTDNPKSSYWMIPFYMQTTSPKSSYYGVLWPFFTYARAGETTTLDAPWPFFSFTRGKEQTGFEIWPVYSYSRNGRDEVTHVLGPLYKQGVRYPADQRWTDKRILLLNRYTVDDRGTFLNVWPFFEYRGAGEKVDFFLPSLIPWRNSQYDRIVRPLLTLYEFKKEGDKSTSNLFYGLYTKEQEGERWSRRLAFLFEMKREPGGYGFEVLSGFFGVDRDRLKLFYIPITRGSERGEKDNR